MRFSRGQFWEQAPISGRFLKAHLKHPGTQTPARDGYWARLFIFSMHRPFFSCLHLNLNFVVFFSELHWH
jgi:hypothetical protein